jgi:dCTP deaminase
VDPKDFDPKAFVEINNQDYCIIPPNSFALAASFEYVKMPKKVIGVCLGKSTYARCGIIVNVTPIEPEWCGHITVEISNTTPLPCKIYSEEGIAQILFFRGEYAAELSYAEKDGIYQGQTGITLPKVRP